MSYMLYIDIFLNLMDEYLNLFTSNNATIQLDKNLLNLLDFLATFFVNYMFLTKRAISYLYYSTFRRTNTMFVSFSLFKIGYILSEGNREGNKFSIFLNFGS